jgi:hypothetical protein
LPLPALPVEFVLKSEHPEAEEIQEYHLATQKEIF